MTTLGYIHWFISVILGTAFIWKETRGEVIAKKPFAVAFVLALLGLALVFTEDDSIPLNISEVFLFRTVNFGSTAIAIAYAFFLLGVTKLFLLKSSSREAMDPENDDSNAKR